jgi:hypothetical protein
MATPAALEDRSAADRAASTGESEQSVDLHLSAVAALAPYSDVASGREKYATNPIGLVYCA